MQSNSVVTLSNSIIGVSILAMPFCFQQCGIILSLIILFFISIISRLACHFLLKSAIISRCRSFEFLAFHMFGPAGKTVIELSIVGFLMGSCVAFFVVVGDLGPAIVKSVLNLDMSVQALRPALLIGVAVFIILPLGLVRDIDSLSSICTISIGFYIIFVLKIIVEATPPIFDSSWADKVNYWRPAGILQCLPIFSSALSCQTQLFEIFGSYLNGPLDKINSAIKSSVNMCTAVYMGVGLFGYIAFCSEPLTGNALMNFPPSLSGDIIKLGFVVSVALSFPLVIFPCRASLYSFLYHQSHSSHYELLTRDTGSGSSQNILTLLIVTISLVLALLVPSVELVLGLLGSTIGVILCYILPSVFFTRLLKKNTNERLLAQVVIIVGVFIMVLGTYTNLFAAEKAISGPEKDVQPNIAMSNEREFFSEMKVGLEEVKKHNHEPFPNVPAKDNLDQVRLDMKENFDQIKVSDAKQDTNKVNLVDSDRGSDQNKADVKKEFEKAKVEEFMKATRKEPLEPVEPADIKHFDENKEIKIDSNINPDLSQNMNKAKPEAVEKETIVEKIKKVPDGSLILEKPAEKQLESPNEIKPPKLEKGEAPIPKVRKIVTKIHEIPPKNSSPVKKETLVNKVNLEGNLRPEIMDKLKDTVPLPIALQKNINVFNVSLSHDVDKTPEHDDKVRNRELLDHQNKNELHHRGRREVQNPVKEELSFAKETNGNENKFSKPAKLLTRSLNPSKTAISEELKNTDIKENSAGFKNSDIIINQAGGKLSVVENVEKTVRVISTIVNKGEGDFNTIIVGHGENEISSQPSAAAGEPSKIKLDAKSTIQSNNHPDLYAIKSDLNLGNQKSDLSASRLGSNFSNQNSDPSVTKSDFNFDNQNTDEAAPKFKSGFTFDQKQTDKFAPSAGLNFDSQKSKLSASKLEPTGENVMKDDTLKEALKTVNSVKVKDADSCPKNSSAKKSVQKNETLNTSNSNLSDTLLNIQAPDRLSSPDNILKGLESMDIEIRNAFQDVPKPFKRDLKSVKVGAENDEQTLGNILSIMKELDNISSKTIEIKDDR